MIVHGIVEAVKPFGVFVSSNTPKESTESKDISLALPLCKLVCLTSTRRIHGVYTRNEM